METPPNHNKLLTDRALQCAAAELGAEHGVSKNGMLKLLREQGVQIRGKSLPTAVVNQAMHLHERGMSMRQVSEQLGVSRTALRRNFREMGVEV